MNEPSDHLTRLQEQMREAAAFAETLVGLAYPSAKDLADERGYQLERLPSRNAIVSADLKTRRVRLVTDADAVVTWTSAG